MTSLPVDIADQDDFAVHRHEFFLVPRLWASYKLGFAFNWQQVLFDASQRALIPTRPGVYCFLIQPSIAQHPACSYLMYVGKADNLRKRFGDYLTKEQYPSGRPKIRRFLYRYRGYIRFCFSEAPSGKITTYEDALIGAFVPPLCDTLPATISKARRAF